MEKIVLEENKNTYIKDIEYDSTDTDENTLYEKSEVSQESIHPDKLFEQEKIQKSESENEKSKSFTPPIQTEIKNEVNTQSNKLEKNENEDIHEKNVESTKKNQQSKDGVTKNKEEKIFNVKKEVQKEIASSEKIVIRLRERNIYDTVKPSYNILYYIEHIIFQIYLSVKTILIQLQNYYYNKTLKVNPSTLTDCVSKLNKIPKHLAIVLGLPENSSTKISNKKRQEIKEEFIKEVINAIQWSIEVDIPTLTFYDYYGHLKQNLKDIIHHFPHNLNFPISSSNSSSTTQDLHSSNSTYIIHFCYSGDLVKTVEVKNYQTINISKSDSSTTNISATEEKKEKEEEVNVEKKSFIINFISYEDSKPAIARLAKNLPNSIFKNVSLEALDNEIIAQSGNMINTVEHRDPNLIMIFGGESDYIQLYGYPPWQIRLSEIYYVSGKPKITYHHFITGLYRYSKCQQRVGK